MVSWGDMSEIREGLGLGNAVADLVSKVFGPVLTRRQADADSLATIQQTLAEQVAGYIDSPSMSQDVMEALISCGGRTNFINLARIVQKAQAQLTEEAMLHQVDDDWVSNFKDKARTCSNEEMSDLWAQLLAGEANSPGSYSRKTVNVLADMEPDDARLFRKLCNFRLIPMDPVWTDQVLQGFKRSTMSPHPKLVVLDDTNSVYRDVGINFDSMARMEWLGLIRYVSAGYQTGQTTGGFLCYEYGGGYIFIKSNKTIHFGCAEFTPSGIQLSELCVPLEPRDGFMDCMVKTWRNDKVQVACSLEEVEEEMDIHFRPDRFPVRHLRL